MSRRVVLVLLTAIVLSLTATCVTRGLRGIFEREAPVVSLPGGSGGVNRPEHREKPYVVLVSFDGFRHDYIDLHETPSFHRIIRNGVRAEGLIPVFPSLTFPNHLSIVTGMYPDRHGIVANRFYDPQRDATYVYSDSTKTRDSEWYQGEPIWVTAEKQGMVTATYFWPGSNAVIDGVRPTYWKPYNGSVPNRKRVDQVLEWLQLSPEKRPHFITLYFSDVDNAGHEYGPGMPETRTAIQEVDRALGHLLDGIAHLPMAEQVYVVLVSDHGMTEIRPETYAALEDVADLTGVRAVFNAAVANLYVQGQNVLARFAMGSTPDWSTGKPTCALKSHTTCTTVTTGVQVTW